MMETLEKELQNIGFSDDFVKLVKNAEQFDTLDVDIESVNFQSFETKIVSSTELKVADDRTSYTNYVIETKSNEQE